ncbi:MAG: PAS domain S-box protein [Lutibacter sp.]|uniref:PAS domain S-box protein n=1 Tax=Lutibacter sp. TaxID=1925666 RepID=UPI00385B6CC6
MKKKVNIKTNLTTLTKELQNPKQTALKLGDKYFTFFEHAPIALWIEDFSEVKKYVENGVKESNLDIESFIRNNNKVIHKISSLMKIKEFNATAVKLYKAKDKLHLLENISRIFTEKSFIDFSQLVIDILLGKKESSIETVNKTLDGKEFNVLIKFSIDFENFENVIVSAENVTDKINSGKKLNTTKNLFSNTLSSIKDGFVILDNNSNYLYINKEATKLLKIKNSQAIIGKNIWHEFPEKEGDIFYDNYQTALKTRRPVRFENYFEPWSRWFENRIIPSNEGMLLFFNEITNQKETEDKIKEAYNIINKSSSIAILCKNKWDFPFEFVSENVLGLFGYTNIELLSNNIKIAELVYPEDLNKIRTQLFKIKNSTTSKTIKPKPFRIITKKGEVKWIRTTIDTVRNKNKEITHIQGIAEDITEQKNTEDLLVESNQRLKDQFNNTPLGSIMWDLDFRILEWNNSAERIFGYSAEEVKGKINKDLLTPPHLLDEMEVLRNSQFAKKKSFINTNENITKSGKIITCEWYSVTLKDAQNNIIGSACLVDDITEQIASKKIIEKSEKRYRDIFEKTIDAVLIIRDGVFVDCNESTLKMFGHQTKESLLQLHPSKISPEKQADGSDSFIKAEEMIQIAFKNGSHRFRWLHQQENGHVFPAEVSLTRIDDIDNTARIHAVVEDITERVKNEKLENVLYNISKAALTINDFKEFGFFIKNQLQQVINTNNFYIAIYNENTNIITTPVFVDEKEEVEDFPAKNSLTGCVLKSKKPLLLTDKEHQELIKKGEVSLIGSSSECWLGVPLIINNKAIGAIVVQSYNNKEAFNNNDVNLLEFVADQIATTIQRKKKDDELKQALLKAQESDKLKSSFLANMSHEIRTPMNGIIGFSELFLEPNLSEKERNKFAKIVINSSRQLLSIVNDILDISKIEAGVMQLDYEGVYLNDLLDNLYGFYKPKAKESNLELRCIKGLEKTKSFIEVDKTKLNQILTNLLSNAFKFTDVGSIEFGYELTGNNLQFFVKDTGVGIEKNLQDKIFDRFIQANIDLSKKLQGTGLGLSISKKFVELFKGKIWVDSNNNGTSMFFTIPYNKLTAVKINSDNKEQKSKIEVKNQEINILVAEDEEYNMMYINELFSKTNFKIIEASNGKEAVELFLNKPEIDLVLMDIKMPIMGGNEAMKAIKKEKPSLPIIALSAFAMESDKKAAIKEGFDAYLTKPIDKKLLFNIINKYSN